MNDTWTPTKAFEDMIDFAESHGALRVSYDRNYGIESKTGWSVIVGRLVLVSFAPTLREAVETAKIRLDEFDGEA